MGFREDRFMRFENHGLVTEILMQRDKETGQYLLQREQRELGDIEKRVTKAYMPEEQIDAAFREACHDAIEFEYDWKGDYETRVDAKTQRGLANAATSDLLTS